MDISRAENRISEWISIAEKMDHRNRKIGLNRFDHGDVLNHPFFAKFYHRLPNSIAKLLRIPEVISPIWWRKLLGIRKKLIPTSLCHLGIFYLIMASSTEKYTTDRSEWCCLKAIDISLDNSHICWEHPYDHHGGMWKDDRQLSVPASCAHHTARLGSLLMHVGKEVENERFKKAGIDAANALLTYHNWHEYSDGRWTVSYYPNTEDEVINTAAEVASLFGAIPPEYRGSDMQTRMEGIVRMIIHEQREDGSWLYCTREHYRTMEGNRVIDNHHTAMVLHALAKLVRPAEQFEMQSKAINTLKLGTRYYLDNFVSENGRASFYPSSARHSAIEGYCEGVIMLSVLLERSDAIDIESELKQEMERTMCKMLDTAIDTFYNESTGDVASFTVFGMPIHIQSIRMGSGLLMEAIARAAAYFEDSERGSSRQP